MGSWNIQSHILAKDVLDGLPDFSWSGKFNVFIGKMFA